MHLNTYFMRILIYKCVKTNFFFSFLAGSAIRSKVAHLFGSVEMHIKLVPGNSAGTVAAYYVNFYLKLDRVTQLFKTNQCLYDFDCRYCCLVNYRLREVHTMRQTSNFQGMPLVSHTRSTPTYLLKGKETASNNSDHGSTLPMVSTTIPSIGIHPKLCK